MKSTWETLIEPVAIELTSAGHREADRLKIGLLACGCYADACHCGNYPAEMETTPTPYLIPVSPDDYDRAENLRNDFDSRAAV